MKRYLAIVLLTALVLVLCLPIFARYEVCSSCGNGRLEPGSTETRREWCSDCGKYVTIKIIHEKCNNCDEEDEDTDYGCSHLTEKYN